MAQILQDGNFIFVYTVVAFIFVKKSSHLHLSRRHQFQFISPMICDTHEPYFQSFRLNTTMTEDRYLLKWAKHGESTREAFHLMRNDQHFCDAAIFCEGQQFNVHKLVLSMSSLVFSQILRDHSHPYPLIYLKGIKACDMKSILDFVYLGEVTLEQSCLQSFKEAAEELKVQGLGDAEDRVKYVPQISTVPMFPETSTAVAKFSLPSPTNPGHISQSVKGAPCVKDEFFDGTFQQPLLDKVKKLDKEVMHEVSNKVKVRKDFNKFITKLKNGGKNGKTLFRCNLCGRTRPCQGHVLDHIESAHFKGVFTYTCPQCGKTFGFRRGLYFHVKRSCKFSQGVKARLSASAKMSSNHQLQSEEVT